MYKPPSAGTFWALPAPENIYPERESEGDMNTTGPTKGKGKGTTGFRDIATALIQDIRQGRITLETRFPTEMELVDRFSVGRNTVREALRELQELGYIRRRRGARSVLTNTNPESGFVNSVRTVEELLDYAKAAHATLLATERVLIDKPLAERLDCPEDTEWVRVGLLRHSEPQGPYFCYSEVYITPRYADVLDEVAIRGQIFPLIEERHGIVVRRVSQEIESILADANIASRLNVAMGSAILLVRTRFFASTGELIEIGLAHFPAGRYKVRIAFDRRGLPGGAVPPE